MIERVYVLVRCDACHHLSQESTHPGEFALPRSLLMARGWEFRPGAGWLCPKCAKGRQASEEGASASK